MASNSKKTVRKNTVTLDTDSLVLNGVLRVVKRGSWFGTMTDLNTALVSTLGKKNSSMLPRSPSALRVVLNRVVRKIRNNKVSVKFGRTTDHSRTRYVEFTR